MGADITKLCMLITFACILFMQDYYCTHWSIHANVLTHIVPVRIEQQNKVAHALRTVNPVDVNLMQIDANSTISDTQKTVQDIPMESNSSSYLPAQIESALIPTTVSTHEIRHGSISSSNLSAHWKKIAIDAHSKIPVKVFMEFGSPHFLGGKTIAKRYLVKHGWTEVEQKSVFAAKDLGTLYAKANQLSFRGQTKVADAAYFIFPSCYYPGAQMLHNKTENLPNTVIHTSLKELGNTNKKKFLVAMQNYYKEKSCDYRNHTPESYLIKGRQSCQNVLDKLDADESAETTRWYTKSAKESFGRGIQIRTGDNLRSEMRRCTFGRIPSYYMAQKEVVNPLLIQGHTIYSRHYVLIVGHGKKEFSAYFIEGYIHRAKDTADTVVAIGETSNGEKPNFRGAIANSAHSGDSKFFFQHKQLQDDLLEAGTYTETDLLLLKQRMKMSAQGIAEAYSKVLNIRKGSFSLLGVDMLFDDTMNVYSLETNCNCEMFIDSAKFGDLRVDLTGKMFTEVLDVVFASTFATNAFIDTMKEQLESKKYDISNEGLSTDLTERETMVEPVAVKFIDFDWRYGELTEEFC